MKPKVGRNDSCPCGSGKKFKKCCENKMLGKRYMVSKISNIASNEGKKSLFSLFHKEEQSEVKKEIKASVHPSGSLNQSHHDVFKLQKNESNSDVAE